MHVRIDSVEPFESSAINPDGSYFLEYADDPPSVMKRVWSNLADALEHGTAIKCTARDVLDGMALTDAVSQAALSG
ncbi:MAG: hypothetical protein RLN70_04960, partial [Rhodospirillaceae bacterium]